MLSLVVLLSIFVLLYPLSFHLCASAASKKCCAINKVPVLDVVCDAARCRPPCDSLLLDHDVLQTVSKRGTPRQNERVHFDKHRIRKLLPLHTVETGL